MLIWAGIYNEKLAYTLQIPPGRLFPLDGFKKRLEITFSKALSPFALNDLKKDSGAVFHWLGKNL